MKKLKWMAAGTLLAGSMLLGSCESEIPEVPETDQTVTIETTVSEWEVTPVTVTPESRGVGVILNN